MPLACYGAHETVAMDLMENEVIGQSHLGGSSRLAVIKAYAMKASARNPDPAGNKNDS